MVNNLSLRLTRLELYKVRLSFLRKIPSPKTRIRCHGTRKPLSTQPQRCLRHHWLTETNSKGSIVIKWFSIIWKDKTFQYHFLRLHRHRHHQVHFQPCLHHHLQPHCRQLRNLRREQAILHSQSFGSKLKTFDVVVEEDGIFAAAVGAFTGHYLFCYLFERVFIYLIDLQTIYQRNYPFNWGIFS